MIETCRSIFKSFNVNSLSVCIGWCADQPMYLISFVHCSLIKITNDQIFFQLSQHNLENVATVHLLVSISILCFSPQCSKGPTALLQFIDVS